MSVTVPPYVGSEPRQPRAFAGVLEAVHAVLRPIGYPVMRIAVGLAFVPHGLAKLEMLTSGHTVAYEKFLTGLGFGAPHAWMVVLAVVEVVGGILLAAGLFTRFAATALGIDLLLIIILVLGPKGFHAYEMILLWGLMVFGIGCIGGGPYSLDGLIGREL